MALSCSYAMAFPISTPPNAIAFSSGTVTTRDMVKTGVIVSLTGLVLVVLGGKLMIEVTCDYFIR